MSYMEVDIDDLEFHEHAGGGAYGSVYKAFWKSRERIVAVKKLLSVDENELQVLSMLSHRNIVQFYCAVTRAPNFCLVTEFATKGSLFAYLSKHALGFRQIVTWAREIALGVNYLHNEAPIAVIHRDLKSKNVVISEDMTAKICDFGCSRFLNNTTKMSMAGTFPWMAPEIIQGLPISAKCDSYSYGVMLWELLTQEVPFKGLEGLQVAWLVVAKHERLTIPSSCPPQFSRLMQWCWQAEPKDRVDFRQILDELQAMVKDDALSDITETFLKRKIEWRNEIEQTLTRLKMLEHNLNERERDLIDRELHIREREKELEQMVQLKAPEDHDIQSWSECDVFVWLRNLGVSGYGRDLAMYAQTFLDHNISGRRLLMLSVDDLKAMGILSVGHRVELLDEIDKLRKQNSRLRNFPPLTKATSPGSMTACPYRVINLTLEVGNYCRRGAEPKQIKWKMYLEVDGDDSALVLIREVTFIFSKAVPIDLVVLHQPPFVMDKWRVGNLGQTFTVECVIAYEGNVKKPRTTRILHEVVLGNEVPPAIEMSIQLQLKRLSTGPPWPPESRDSGINIEYGSVGGSSQTQTPTVSVDAERHATVSLQKTRRGSSASEISDASRSYSHTAKTKLQSVSMTPAGVWSDKGNTTLALGIGPYSGQGNTKVQRWPMAKDVTSRPLIVGVSTRKQTPIEPRPASPDVWSGSSKSHGNITTKASGDWSSRSKPRGQQASHELGSRRDDRWKNEARRGRGGGTQQGKRGKGAGQRDSQSLKIQKNEGTLNEYRRTASNPEAKYKHK